jgi:hypothetical protein
MNSVTILGAVPSPPITRDYEGEVWGCNSLWKTAFDEDGKWRATRWFELHPRSANTVRERADVWYCAAYRCPIYVLDAGEWLDKPDDPYLSDIPNHHLPLESYKAAARQIRWFPIEPVAKLSDFFCCTFAYQIGLALVEGFDEIVCHGIDLTRGSKRERLIEKPNLEWWLGFAEGRGVKIIHPVDSRMSRHNFRYGYDYDAELQDCKEWVKRFDDAPDI